MYLVWLRGATVSKLNFWGDYMRLSGDAAILGGIVAVALALVVANKRNEAARNATSRASLDAQERVLIDANAWGDLVYYP